MSENRRPVIRSLAAVMFVILAGGLFGSARAQCRPPGCAARTSTCFNCEPSPPAPKPALAPPSSFTGNIATSTPQVPGDITSCAGGAFLRQHEAHSCRRDSQYAEVIAHDNAVFQDEPFKVAIFARVCSVTQSILPLSVRARVAALAEQYNAAVTSAGRAVDACNVNGADAAEQQEMNILEQVDEIVFGAVQYPSRGSDGNQGHLKETRSASGAPDPDDPDFRDKNQLHHIFDNPRHELDWLVQEEGGEEKALSALKTAVQQQLMPTEGETFKRSSIVLNGRTVFVSGRVVDGFIRISSAYI